VTANDSPPTVAALLGDGFKVGQQVYVVPDRGGKPHYRTIVKVGRKYVHCEGDFKFATEHMHCLYGGTDHRVYLSEHHYEEEKRADVAWRWLRDKMGWRRPLGVKESDIYAAASALGYEMPKPDPERKEQGA